jgi:hypothetical protein
VLACGIQFYTAIVGLHKAIFHDTARPSPSGYFVSLAFVIQYPHFICRKLSATRNGSRQTEFDLGYL